VSGYLPVKGFTRPGSIYTLSKSIIVKSIGSVWTSILDKVFASLEDLFGKAGH